MIQKKQVAVEEPSHIPTPLELAVERVKGAAAARDGANKALADWNGQWRWRQATAEAAATKARLIADIQSAQAEFNLACQQMCEIKNKNEGMS